MMVNRAVAISILVVVLCVGGLFAYFKFGGATLINKDLPTLVLSSEDVMYPLFQSGYLSVKEAADIYELPESRLKQWGYDKAYATYFGSPERPMVASSVCRFSSVDGAASMFSISSSTATLNPDWEKLASEKHIFSILSVEISGYESSTWRCYSGEDEYFIIFFRGANIFVDVEARTLSATKTYAQIIEEKI